MLVNMCMSWAAPCHSQGKLSCFFPKGAYLQLPMLSGRASIRLFSSCSTCRAGSFATPSPTSVIALLDRSRSLHKTGCAWGQVRYRR